MNYLILSFLNVFLKFLNRLRISVLKRWSPHLGHVETPCLFVEGTSVFLKLSTYLPNDQNSLMPFLIKFEETSIRFGLHSCIFNSFTISYLESVGKQIKDCNFSLGL